MKFTESGVRAATMVLWTLLTFWIAFHVHVLFSLVQKTPFYLCIVFLIFNCGWNFPRFSQFVESIFRWRKNQSNKRKMCVLQNENKLTAHKPSCSSVCYKFVSACDISYFHDQKFNVAAFCFFLAVHWIPAIFTCFLSLFSLLVPSLCYFLCVSMSVSA